MNFLYFDCFSGISGDMLVGALLDLGVDIDNLRSQIAKLNLNVNISSKQSVVNGIKCTRFIVDSCGLQPVRHLVDIEKIIRESSLSNDIKQKSIAVFRRLAEAEAAIHGVDISKIHFHEIGAVDTIVDIVSTFCCLNILGIEQVISSPLPWTNGFIDISHGRYPLPAPAVAHLLMGIPCTGNSAGIELITPTGAALITSITSAYGTLPDCIPQAIGYGAGTLVRSDNVPNLLRLIQAASYDQTGEYQDTVAVLETEVDDINPEYFTYLYDLFVSDKNVLDFYTTPIYMKKNRPGFLLTLIVSPQFTKHFSQLLLRETSTLGLRYRLQNRVVLDRSYTHIDTPWGKVRVKIGLLPGGGKRCKPEFEDISNIAKQHNLPIPEVYATINTLIASLDSIIEKQV